MEIQKPSSSSFITHKIRVLTLTFIAYASFHASRKPPSITKSLLASTWPPFNSPHLGPHRLGDLDLSFLFSYSLSMFLSGPLSDRLPLRLLLLLSSLLSSLSCLTFALAFFLDIHSFTYFLSVQIVGGFFQSFGWPCVVAVVGNWFGRSERKGLIMGVWNSHTSVGNILGSVMASSVLEFGWGWAFAVPGVVMGLVGVGVFGFLVVSPKDVGFEGEEVGEILEVEMEGREDVGLLEEKVVEGEGLEKEERAIGFFEAWRLPGVAPFALCLFFSKLVAYTFLYWLPFYIRHTSKFI